MSAAKTAVEVDEFAGLEAWVNTIDGRIVLQTRDSQGGLTDTIVAGGKTVHVSPADRRLNQDKVASKDLDPFQNGYLAPVRLIEGDRDTAKLSSNPNVLSEDDMLALFEDPYEAFTARLQEITLPITLQRMLRMITQVENATVRQQEAIKDRIAALQPTTYTEVISAAGEGGRPTVGRAVQPR